METDVKRYMDDKIRESREQRYLPSEKKQIIDTIQTFQKIGLITNEEYQQWKIDFESVFSMGIEELGFDNGIVKSLRRICVLTCGQLREILISDKKEVNFFRIRNIGEIKQERIVSEALLSGLVTLQELGMEYESDIDIKKWALLKARVVKA